MSHQNVKCSKCGYTPRDSPVSGVWYCPKCGKRMTIAASRPRVTRKFYRKPVTVQKSRDQVTSQIYRKLADEKPTDLGLKESYLNPKIDPILPKPRDKMRLFYKKD